MLIPELLSPAGNPEKLKIALAYGADAVYAGVSHFSLRIRSGKEFTYESFKEAVDYTHSLGKKIYVTINGFPFNSQLGLLEKHIEKMANMNPDAFIIAAPGVVKLSKKIAPNIPIHLSTQANVLNYLDAEVFYDMGVKRIVAAREVGIKDLVEIKKHLPKLEIEAFVHGSMCFAYSGRCLISAVQSGRVPNRGSCANDCRFEYTLYAASKENGTLFRLEEDENGTRIMNAKDLNLSSHLDEIFSSGVIDALKIEGRTKSPYYVAVTTKVYKQAIEDYKNGKLNTQYYQKELATTKHRGFNDGYLIQRPYEKTDTQELKLSLVEGSGQICAQVGQNGLTCKSKDILTTNKAYEIMLPVDGFVEEVENDTGRIWHENGIWWIKFYELRSINNKLFESIHSGNENEVVLPIKLPSWSCLRLLNKY